MTIVLRNYIIFIGLLLSLAILIFLIISIIFLLNENYQFTSLNSTINIFETMGSTYIIVLFSVIFGFILRFFFKKTISIEIFFFTLFIISLAFESLKVIHIFLQMYDMPLFYGILVTRIVFSIRFFGIFCLLSSGLFSTGIQSQKFEFILGISFILAISLASSIPINDNFLPTLNYEPGNEKIFVASFVLIKIFSVLNFCWAAFKKHSGNYLAIAISIILIIIGRDMIFFLHNPIHSAIGTLIIIPGSIIFANRMHSIYLWS